MVIWFFTIPVWVILVIILLVAGFFEKYSGIFLFLLDLFVLSILLFAVLYLIIGLYKLFKVEGERFEGFIIAVISAVVIFVWWGIFMC